MQGEFLNTVASKTVKVLVVGNPANTNALIAAECAPNIPKGAFFFLTILYTVFLFSLARALSQSRVEMDVRRLLCTHP